VRRTTAPINANAASLASGIELFCRIAGNNRRLRRKTQHFQALTTFCCTAQTIAAELALFDTVIVQKYAPTHWSAWLSSTLSIGR
jgi:hypothetical protein